MPPLSPTVQALVLINVAVYCLDFFAGGMLTHLFALYPFGSAFMPWQIASYGFLHGDLVHLLFNMLGLWMFGTELEMVWGRKRFLQFYAASVLAAAITHLLIAPLMGSGAPVVGASGGLFGLLLAYGLTFPHRTIMLLIPPMPIKAKTMAMVYGVLTLVFAVTGTFSGIAHFAHLGGMLGGYLMIRYWRGKPPFGRR